MKEIENSLPHLETSPGQSQYHRVYVVVRGKIQDPQIPTFLSHMSTFQLPRSNFLAQPRL